MTNKQKRNRLPNFTPHEESFLLSLTYKYVNVIESKLTDGQIWEEKRKIWENIDIEFGKKFGFRRGWKNLREKYDNLKRKLRRMESKERIDGQTFQKVFVDENIEKLPAIVGFSSDYMNDVVIDGTFEKRPHMNNDDDKTAMNYILPTDPNQDSEPIENEGDNGRLSSNSNYSAQNKKIKTARRPRKERFIVREELRSAEKHRWDSNRNKREAEKRRWEMEKHKLIVEKQKWELKEARLKTKILQIKLKNLLTGDGSKSPVSVISEDNGLINLKSNTGIQDNTNTHNVNDPQNFINIDALATNIKIEPTLDITDIGNDYALNEQIEKRKSSDVNVEVLVGMCKKFGKIQQVSSEEQHRWEQALKNDMHDAPNIADSSRLVPMQLVNTNINSYDDNENDTCNVSREESILLETTTDDQMKASMDDHGFLALLNKHKLQHYLPKLKEMNIDSDYLQYIHEIDIRDICVRDIGARIRFRGLLEDWRTSHSIPKTTFINPQMELDVTNGDIAELKTFIKNTQNTLLKDHYKSVASKVMQYEQKSNYKKVLPETPYRSVLDFKTFEELIKNSEEAYQNLIAELTTQNINNSVNFLKTSWRRIMSDHVAQHFCWTGTLEKPAIRILSITKALKEAYQRKFDYCTNDDFQRTIQPFFQHAKTRLQKKQNYEKLKAANTTL